MMEIQSQMSERAVELLGLPEDESCLIVDLGCGSGLSGETLDEHGHLWIGVDISSAMLGEFRLQSFDVTLLLPKRTSVTKYDDLLCDMACVYNLRIVWDRVFSCHP
jgi:trans-aconitate methyltransferase